MKVPRMNRRGLCIQISLAVLFGCLANTTHGYNETLNATWGGIDVYSPGYRYNLPYGPNTTYDYLVKTIFPDHNVTMEVIGCEMEHDKNGACLYDKLRIYDGSRLSLFYTKIMADIELREANAQIPLTQSSAVPIKQTCHPSAPSYVSLRPLYLLFVQGTAARIT
ncbi:uncharacterized protein LOC128225797 [Mya arenaria]|uniref:uncharacterized protein LOC128225797 n=1 Tax=Mya arenaria TaxID=6604 RepID=UPI0022E1B084|nr:uncharacterized protein LOC128225797 [Mya arenaria]